MAPSSGTGGARHEVPRPVLPELERQARARLATDRVDVYPRQRARPGPSGGHWRRSRTSPRWSPARTRDLRNARYPMMPEHSRGPTTSSSRSWAARRRTRPARRRTPRSRGRRPSPCSGTIEQFSRPERHHRHVPQVRPQPRNADTVARPPALHARPQVDHLPDDLVSRHPPRGDWLSSRSARCRSLRHTPHNRTRTSSSSAPGRGSGRSTCSTRPRVPGRPPAAHAFTASHRLRVRWSLGGKRPVSRRPSSSTRVLLLPTSTDRRASEVLLARHARPSQNDQVHPAKHGSGHARQGPPGRV